MTEPTDDDVEQIAAEIQVIACEYGHVHFQIVEIGGKEDCGLHTVFSPVEARSLARGRLSIGRQGETDKECGNESLAHRRTRGEVRIGQSRFIVAANAAFGYGRGPNCDGAV